MEQALKTQLSSISKITNFYYNSTDKVGVANQTLSHFESRLEILETYWSRFLDRHDVLTEMEDKWSGEKYFAEDMYTKVEAAYADAKARIRDRIAALRPAISNRDPNIQDIVQSISAAHVTLPRLSLPTFTGKQGEWESFKQRFSSLVKDKANIPKVAKLQHLVNAVQGQAAQRLKGLDITEANFDIAWDKLVRRYDNPRIRLFNTLEGLLQLPSVRSRHVLDLNDLIDRAEEAVRSLRDLNCPTDSYDYWIVHCIVRKLDVNSREAWEVSQENSQDFSTYVDLIKFLERRIQSLEEARSSVERRDQQNTSASNSNSRNSSRQVSANNTQITESPNTKTVTPLCDLCKNDHWLHRCSQFNAFTQAQRLDFCKKEKLCLNCLRKSHFVDKCPSPNRCLTCEAKHHTKLHFEKGSQRGKQQSNSQNASQNSSSVTSSPTEVVNSDSASTVAVHTTLTGASVLLATARVILTSARGESITVRALIDPASERCFITSRTALALHLTSKRTSRSIIGLGGTQATKASSEVSCILNSSHDPSFSLNITALVLNELTRFLPQNKVEFSKWSHIKGLALADPNFDSPSKVDCVLGADAYPALILNGLVKGPLGAPIAQDSVFGWILTGAVAPNSCACRDKQVRVFHTYTEPSLSSTIAKLWELEDIPRKTLLTPEEELCETLFLRTFTRDRNGRFIVRLPFSRRPALADSRSIAKSCLLSLEKRLQRNPQLAADYSAFMDNYIDQNHMEVVPATQLDRPCAYLPHHAVVKPENPTKIRVVFNASQKTVSGQSINDFLLPGPKLQADILIVLTHWRFFRFALTADVVQMFRQIRVHHEDIDWQRILWRKHSTQAIQDYRCTTVTYGTAAAPYLALRVLKQLAEEGAQQFPEASAILHHQLYVDDFFFGGDTIAEAMERRDQLIGLLGSAGMTLDKWAANHAALLEGLVSNSNHDIAVKLDQVISTLGLNWQPKADHFMFKVDATHRASEITKRSILSEIAKLFDPLGWLAPILIKAKIILQDIWIDNLDWDTPVPDDLEQRWTHFRDELNDIPTIRIPRWLHIGEQEAWQLHGFADASKRAFAASIYAVVPGRESALLVAKTKLAPTNIQTLPRLELCAATLLARLITHLLSNLRYSPTKITCWSDSTVVLEWLKSHPSRWQTFVANRTSEIRTSLPNASWKHVRTHDNAADCATRGLSPMALAQYKLWWHGPPWITCSESEWPSSDPVPESTHALTTLEESEPLSSSADVISDCLPSLQRFSHFGKIIRILAYCCRWRLRVMQAASQKLNGTLSLNELNYARIVCFRSIQLRHFTAERKIILAGKQLPKRSPLARLNPFICEQGLIRVGGRLQLSSLSYSEKFPIVLPGNCTIVKRMVEEVHRLTLHGGAQLMRSHLRRTFWISRDLRVTSGVVQRCVTCTRFNARTSSQQMGPLPSVRITPTRPFTSTGLDYAGPISVLFSKGRGAKSSKAYVAIFICLVTRAVHIEVVSDLTTPTFLAAYARFCARRGVPSIVFSDNATTFKGAAKELDDLFAKASPFVNLVSETLATQGTQWSFIPPRAPHFGGLWEAAVRSFKHHFRRVVGESTFTFEELSTLVAKIEACLNSRPLCPLSNDGTDVSALTPAHFLTGSSLLSYPEPYEDDAQPKLVSRWRLVSSLRDSFWSRWRKEVLHHLQQRHKWLNPTHNLETGDVVLLKDELAPPTQWPMGIITATHPGADGLVRVASVKTATSTFTRPVVKLIKLPTDAELEQCLSEQKLESNNDCRKKRSFNEN